MKVVDEDADEDTDQQDHQAAFDQARGEPAPDTYRSGMIRIAC